MNIGDKVRFLNDVGGGIVSRIDGKTVYVTDDDGFDTPVLINQCVVVPTVKADGPIKTDDPDPFAVKKPAVNPAPRLTAKGFNVALIFEPHDIKRLSVSPIDLFLVNDTNYHLHYALSCRDRLDSSWTLLGQGVAEPCSQAFIREFLHTELNPLENIAVHALAYKEDGPFELTNPIAYQQRFDVTRLAKLHCFTTTAYSTVPVLTVPVVTNGKPVQALQLEMLSPGIDPQLKDRPQGRRPQPTKPDGPKVVDLHAHELLDTVRGMQPAEILAYQLDVFRKQMREAFASRLTEIIFIHGKGEGVLRKAILDALRRQWPRCQAQDASFLEYGFGATKVILHK